MINWLLAIFLIVGVGLVLLVMCAYGASRYREGRDAAETKYRLRIIEIRRDHKVALAHEWDRGYAKGLKDQHDDPNAYKLYFKKEE